MRFGVVGDVHGDFDALDRVMARHGDVAFWLSVGDVAGVDMRYPEPRAPFYWIQGNNEDFDFISRCATGLGVPSAAAAPGAPLKTGGPTHGNALRFLPNGTCTVVDGTAVAGLGGTFAPTWYDTPPGELPFPGFVTAGPRHAVPLQRARVPARGASVRDDKRRHFVHAQVDALKAMRGVDVLLTHEASRPFIVQAGAGRRLDAGKAVINELLAAMRPQLHFFGHHHRFSDAVREGVRSIGLDLLSHSYVLVDAGSFECERLDT
jgi:hypothetical protein